jgi:ATP-dependent Clp protease ATP-binding subunit ClpC
MLERFGEKARRVVALAGDEAHSLGHGYIGTEHLLLGLVAETGTTASNALAAAGVVLAACREKVREALASRPTTSSVRGPQDLPFTDRANRALERASRLSLHMGSESVNCEQILVSVLDVEGTAGQVLRGLGVDPDAVRQALASAPSCPPADNRSSAGVAAPTTEDGAKASRRAAGPLCAACRSPLRGSLAHVELGVGSGPTVRNVTVFYCTICGTAIGTGPP